MRGGRSSFAMAFIRDEAGVLTILSLLFFVMLMAAGGLSIDLGRLYGERGQMQAFVDNAALSAASQLDRSHDAMDRAVCAAMGTSNSNCTAAGLAGATDTFSTNAPGNFTVTKVTFLKSLDSSWQPSDATPAPNDQVLCTFNFDTSTGIGSWSASSCDTVAANNAESQYVEVVTAPRTVSYFLLPIIDFIGTLKGAASTIDQQSLSLRATAGYKQVICDNVPLMVCNPDESTGSKGVDFDLNGDDDGKQLFAYGQSNGGPIGPGMFGLLATFGSGANAVRDAFSKADPNTTCTEESVPPRTGVAAGPDSQGVNVRFDIFNGGGLSRKDSTINQTAPVVVKGETTTVNGNSNSCQYNQSSQTMPYPRDHCFMSNGGSSGAGGTGCGDADSNGTYRMGDCHWARQEYWTQNHPSDPQPTGYIDASNPCGGWTRYETYLYEASHQVNRDEKGGPSCSTSATTSADRRVFTIAVVNCESEDVTSAVVPVKAYAHVFLTEPVGNTAWSGNSRGGLTWPTIQNADTYVEVVGVVKPGDNTGKLHQFPVLYR